MENSNLISAGPFTSGLEFLAHNQLHEVLFGFLEVKDVLNYRCLHSACDDVVMHYAEMQLQDVLCQNMPAEFDAAFPRTMDVCLVKLLRSRADDFGHLLASIAHSIRCITGSRNLFRGAQNTICAALCEIVDVVASNCPQLQLLGVGRMDGKNTDDTLKRVAAHCPQLQRLEVLYANGGITDESMKLFATNCRQLKYLNLRYGIAITDASIELVAHNCPELQVLDVSHTKAITDASIALIATKCVQLQVLAVAFTDSRISDESMRLLALNCPQLRSVKFGYNEGKITDATIKLVAKKLQTAAIAGCEWD